MPVTSHPHAARVLGCILPTLGAIIVLAVAGFAVADTRSDAAPAAAAAEHLPDLDQEMPTQLVVTRGDRRPTWRLGFRSAVRNVGNGPLIIDGTRPSAGVATMTADQVVERDGAPSSVLAGVGRLQYVRSPDHQHWHLLGFERYELRRPKAGRTSVEDSKTGFCLGDRYRVTTRVLPAAPGDPAYASRCGLNHPALFGIREGISVGYGDDYAANLEGQWLSLDGLRAGSYLLVHRVNADRRLRELSYANNAASLLIRLRWRARVPEITLLASCPTTARCVRRPAARRSGVAAPRGVRVSTVATGLEIPWDIAFLPGGSALVTERPGRVRLLERSGRLRQAPVARVHASAQGEGGLLGVAVDPRFAANRFVYLYFTTAAGMRLERWRWSHSRLVRETTLIDGIDAGPIHDSGRIAFGPDRRLYVSTGDAGQPELAQDPSSLNGKLLALTAEEYHATGDVRPEIVADGLRNSQGFDWQPGTGRLIATEHGPSGFDGPEGYDEVNQIVPGGNYGWPRVFGSTTGGGRFIAPLRVYDRAVAPSGATFVTRPGSSWTGDYLFATLRGQGLRRLRFDGGRVVGEQALLSGRYGRLRTVVEGPRGDLYVLTSNRDGRSVPRAHDDRILRIVPPRG
jgi:glucose/arabinose dehydrogenase